MKDQKLTELGNQLAETCFKRELLLPEAIGETSWVGGTLDVLTAEAVHHSTKEYLDRLLSLLHISLVKANLHSPSNEFSRSDLLETLPLCVVLIRDLSLYRLHMEKIRAMANGRDTILAFIGKKDIQVVKQFNVCDVLECGEADPQSWTDMMNKINGAVRRKVKLAGRPE